MVYFFSNAVCAPATSTVKSQGITTSTELGHIMTFNTAAVIAGAVVGGIVGCLLVLVLIILLLMLASLWLTKKYNYKRATERKTYQLQQLREGGVTETEQQLQDNQTLEMKENEAYATALQISTENNIAYVKMENDYINDQGEYDYV